MQKMLLPSRLICFVALILAVPALAADAVDFTRDIRPIFQKSCGQCHMAGASMGKLRLDSPAAVLQGGVSSIAVVPGKSAASLLIKRLGGLTDAPRMPLNADPLSSAQIALIERWIDSGDFSATPATGVTTTTAPMTAAPASPLFAQKIRPILASRCYSCHGAGVQQNGLRLDSLAAIRKGSDSGPVVTPGNAGNSRLLRRMLGEELPRMPYGGVPLARDEIAAIRQWIDAGAPGPDSELPLHLSSTATGKHWSFVKPVHPALPGSGSAVGAQWH